jgi:hypothetical protein
MAAATLEELQAFRARLIASRANPAREVEDSSGKRVSYRSDAELASAIQAIDREIAQLQGAGTVSTVRFTTSKGL